MCCLVLRCFDQVVSLLSSAQNLECSGELTPVWLWVADDTYDCWQDAPTTA